MRVLVACEESQAVCIAFRERGHEAYSCDIQPCSGGHPEWHIQADARELIKLRWDLMIVHPPCTDLAVSGAKWFKQKQEDGRQQAAIDFVLLLEKLAATGVCRKWARLISSEIPVKANTSSGHSAAADGYAYQPSGFAGPKGA